MPGCRSPGRHRWPSSLPPTPRWRSRSTPCRCSAATATSRNIRWRDAFATPKPARSTRAPTRYSESSSPASWEQKRKHLRARARGEQMGAFALAEPGSGSDAGGMRTRAIRRGDTYVMNGSKTFITGGSVADTIVVFARTDQNGDAPARDISAFIVEKTMPGFKVGKLEKKMGIRGSPTAQLFFEDLAVPAANRLGNEGDGFKLAMRVLDHSRPGIAAQALGIAEGAFDLARRYG